jgi:multicomponent Na+:H+ antiporter subunit E
VWRSGPTALLLFGFWALLSGELDAFHLGAGAFVAVAVTALTEPLLTAEPEILPAPKHPITGQPWGALLRYLPWLALEIVRANLHVARVVLAPSLPIDPRLVRLRHPLPHNLARMTLANSITLTPGTVTLDVVDDEYLVHALTVPMAEGLSEGELPRRVGAVFGDGSAGA